MLDDETILSEPRTVILGSLIDNLSTIIHYCELYDCINAILSLKDAQKFLIEDLIAFEEMDCKENPCDIRGIFCTSDCEHRIGNLCTSTDVMECPRINNEGEYVE